MSDLHSIGRIIGSHGAKGLMRFSSHMKDPFVCAPFFDKDRNPLSIENVSHYKGKTYLVRMPGVKNMIEANAFKDLEIFVLKENLPEDDYSHLVGLPVFDENDVEYGNIVAIKEHGAGPYLEIQRHDEKNNINAFFHKDAIMKIASDRVVLRSVFIISS